MYSHAKQFGWLALCRPFDTFHAIGRIIRSVSGFALDIPSSLVAASGPDNISWRMWVMKDRLITSWRSHDTLVNLDPWGNLDPQGAEHCILWPGEHLIKFKLPASKELRKSKNPPPRLRERLGSYVTWRGWLHWCEGLPSCRPPAHVIGHNH